MSNLNQMLEQLGIADFPLMTSDYQIRILKETDSEIEGRFISDRFSSFSFKYSEGREELILRGSWYPISVSKYYLRDCVKAIMSDEIIIPDCLKEEQTDDLKVDAVLTSFLIQLKVMLAKDRSSAFTFQSEGCVGDLWISHRIVKILEDNGMHSSWFGDDGTDGKDWEDVAYYENDSDYGWDPICEQMELDPPYYILDLPDGCCDLGEDKPYQTDQTCT